MKNLDFIPTNSPKLYIARDRETGKAIGQIRVREDNCYKLRINNAVYGGLSLNGQWNKHVEGTLEEAQEILLKEYRIMRPE